MVNWKPFAFKMKCKCGKLFSHNYKAYCCSELKVRIPLNVYLYNQSNYVRLCQALIGFNY